LKKTIFSKTVTYSIWIVIGIFIFFWIFFAIQIKELKNVGESSLNNLSEKILVETDKNFKKNSEEIVLDKTKCLAETIKYYLINKGKLHRLSGKEIGNLLKDPEFQTIVSQKIGKTGYVVIVEDNGTIRFHPEKKFINTTELIEEIPQLKNILAAGQQKKQASGYYPWINPDGKKSNKFLAGTRIENTNLFALITVQLDELFAPMTNIKKDTRTSIDKYKLFLNMRFLDINRWIAAVLTISLLITVIIVYFSVKNVTKPIMLITEHAQELGKANFGHEINVKTGDEIEFLAAKLNEMALGLKDYYLKLEEVNKKLKQANEELADIDRIKSEFISIASHELKTPLTIIRGFSDIARSEALKKGTPDCMDQAKNLEIIVQQTDRLTKMVEEFLDISRIESGLIKIELSEIKIQESIKKIVQLFCIQVIKHNFKIEKIEDLPAINADKNLIEQLLTNLIANAVNYSPENTTITIGGSSTKDEITLYIKDEGIGIERTDQKRIFTKLYRQKNNEIVHKTKGIGLGLAITKGIIDIHHGKIWAESDGANKGSKFIFQLPIKNKQTIIVSEVKKFLGS